MGRGFAEQPQDKPGFFGKGGAGRAIAGSVGDFLLQRSGVGPMYAPVMQQQQQQAAQMAAEQRKRSLDMADWLAKEQWKRENPMPVNNDTERDIELMRGMLPPEQFEQYLQNNYINPTFYTGPDGRRYANPSINRPAVGSVLPDPRKQGGTGGNVGGGF